MERGREREKQDRRGSECYSSESNKARQIQWRNPPSSQMNIAASLPPPPSPPPSVSIVVIFPSSLPRSFSIIHQRAESPPDHGSSCCVSSQTTEPAGSPPHPARVQRLPFPTSIRPSILASIHRHGDSELALSCC